MVFIIKIANWIQLDNDKCKCSNCEAIAVIAMYPPGADKNFCPNCVAKMGNFDLDELKNAVVKISRYCAFFEYCDECCFKKDNECLLNYSVSSCGKKLEERESEQ